MDVQLLALCINTASRDASYALSSRLMLPSSSSGQVSSNEHVFIKIKRALIASCIASWKTYSSSTSILIATLAASFGLLFASARYLISVMSRVCIRPAWLTFSKSSCPGFFIAFLRSRKHPLICSSISSSTGLYPSLMRASFPRILLIIKSYRSTRLILKPISRHWSTISRSISDVIWISLKPIASASFGYWWSSFTVRRNIARLKYRLAKNCMNDKHSSDQPCSL
mmetsp:Transcript_27313/g.59274  ORF Transcript_27313/g.59274 Transcript_27313/m.59274 type:complete len:226 (-) Transcript_27313:1149-1826(-)